MKNAIGLVFLALLASCGGSISGTNGVPSSALWTETSTSIDVSCFEFWRGSMRFAATRDQLSAAQLTMLSDMRAIDAAPTCVADVMGCSLSIGQADGSTTKIDAIETDSGCQNPRKIVSYETFRPFLDSLACQYAKQLAGSAATSTPVPPDVRCFNGLFIVPEATIPVPLQLGDVSTAHRIELDLCTQPGRLGKIAFSLVDSDGTTVLGTSNAPAAPGADGTCAFLEQTFPHPGTFTLNVQVGSGDGIAGDLYVRFY